MKNDKVAQPNSKIVIRIRPIMAMTTAIDEGMIFDKRRLNPTSVIPKLLGESNNTDVIKPIILQAPIT